MTIGCAWIAHLYFTNEAYATGIKQWTVRDMPNFEDLIPKLGWMFWAIISYAYLLVCLDHILILWIGFSMVWVHNVFDGCIMCFGELYVMGIGFSWF